MQNLIKHPLKLSKKNAILLAVAALAFSTSSAFAQAQCTFNTTWTDHTGGWYTAANWSGGVPTSSLNAFINNGGTAQVNSSLATANACSLTLGSNAADSGTVLVNTNATLAVVNSAVVGSKGNGTVTLTGAGAVSSAGLSIAQPSGSSGTVTVDGSSHWTVSGAADVGGGTQLATGGNGLLQVTNGGNVSAGSVHVGMSGKLGGEGTIQTTNGTTMDGTLSPHKTLSFTSTGAGSGANLNMGLYATTQCNVIQSDLAIEVDNVDVVQGNASLNGTLSVTMTGVFQAPAQYILLHAGGGLNNTTFSNVSITYPHQGWTPQITYDSTHVYLKLNPN
jgi:T5SS/PEP-CTERM-associated repeat protein